MKTLDAPILGLIPAAGFATRLPHLAGSKEVLSVSGRPAVAWSLMAMAKAGISDVVIVLRPEKRDLIQTLGTGSDWGVRITYVETEATSGPAETLDRAWEHMKGANVALSFPDILMEPDDPFTPLLEAWDPRRHDAVLGLLPATPAQPADPVGWTPDGSITRIGPKAEAGTAPWCWGLAVWSPAMTDFMHELLEASPEEAPHREHRERTVGWVLSSALEAGRPILGVLVSNAPFLDIGTPRGLAWAEEGRRSPPPASVGGSKAKKDDPD